MIAMYLRFVVRKCDETSHRPQGLFTVAYDLVNDGDLTPDERSTLQDVLIWFEKNLPSPGSRMATRAIYWYKDSAHECIRRMWELASLLETQGYYCDVLKYRSLGNIVWEDENQVKAYPSRDDVRW
jgi:hypothetical protein